MTQCRECGAEIKPNPIGTQGRKKEFCDRVCQLKAYNRKRRVPAPNTHRR